MSIFGLKEKSEGGDEGISLKAGRQGFIPEGWLRRGLVVVLVDIIPDITTTFPVGKVQLFAETLVTEAFPIIQKRRIETVIKVNKSLTLYQKLYKRKAWRKVLLRFRERLIRVLHIEIVLPFRLHGGTRRELC